MSQVAAIDCLTPPEAVPDLGRRVPAIAVPQPVALASLRLLSRAGLDATITAALIDTLAVLVGTGQPDRLAAALAAWALRAGELARQGGSSQITLAHNIVRGKTGGIEVSTTLKF